MTLRKIIIWLLREAAKLNKTGKASNRAAAECMVIAADELERAHQLFSQ